MRLLRILGTPRNWPRDGNSGSQAGFSLIELLLALVVAAEILIAASMAFDISNRAAAVQTQITDLQQSLRIVQHDIARLVRMAGRGGLSIQARPDLAFAGTPVNLQGHAVEVRNNVDDDAARGGRRIGRDVAESPLVLTGTDVLIVRGCFTSPLYQVEPASFVPSADNLTATLRLNSQSVIGIQQPLEPLCEELRSAGGGTFILTSPEGRSVYGIAQLQPGPNPCGASGPAPSPLDLNLSLAWVPPSPLNPDVDSDPVAVDRRFPENMEAVMACLLEEYRYYVQEIHEDPADTSSPLRPVLARARFEPGTELPYGGDAQNYALPLADGVIDLQVALGFDSDFPSTSNSIPGSIDDDLDNLNTDNDEVIYEAPTWTARNQDDWLFNHPGDTGAGGLVPAGTDEWRVHSFTGRGGQAVDLYQVRITTIARTNRADRTYQAPDFDPDPARDFVEDHDYDTAPANAFKSIENRKFRRRSLTTVVDLRNL